MRKITLLFTVFVFCPFAVLVHAQHLQNPAIPGLARPHRGSPRVAAAVSPAALLPYETPASLACIYQLTSPLVPGCPVLGTTALSTGGSGMIVIVNAFDNPPAQADLNIFSAHFGLPTCDPNNKCFSKVYATGVKPPVDELWAQNAAVVTEYAHGFAPQAQIVLVEAASSAVTDMWIAVRKANNILKNHGGGQMILPFSTLEDPTQTQVDPLFTTPGVVYISGNEGSLDFFDYPGTSPNVVCLGGSSVIRDSQGNFVREESNTFWAGGQSLFESRPSYQDGIADIIGNQRGIPDLAFASDPIKGAILYYTSVNFDGFVGWIFEGNVGVAEAAWAGIINRAGTHASSSAEELSMLYGSLGDTSVFNDITKGQAFGIFAKPGWDFLTGIGTPVGLQGK